MTYELPTLPKPAAFDIYEKSRETMEWLRNNIKVGFTAARGPAWWANGATTKAGDWTEIPDGSHFDGPVPIEAVLATLDVQLVKGQVHVTYLDENGERQVVADPAVQPIVNAKTGKVFSYPKESYAIHPYLQTLHGFIQKIQYDEAVAVASVGLLRNGGVAFLQAVLPEQFEVAGFGYVPYLMAVTSADLSRRTQFALGFKAGRLRQHRERRRARRAQAVRLQALPQQPASGAVSARGAGAAAVAGWRDHRHRD